MAHYVMLAAPVSGRPMHFKPSSVRTASWVWRSAGYSAGADIITAWFPFVTPASVLAWRLPLSLLKPEKLFRQIQHNLGPKGLFLMVNHGATEAELAARWCDAAGLRLAGQWTEPGPLNTHRLSPPVLSWWQRR